jgi:DNA segregation ATPase FtsK/SpoIIIE-like protein
MNQHDRDSAELRRLCAERDRLKDEVEQLQAELREKVLASAVDAIAYRGVVYRVQRERAGTEIGPAGLQRMFLIGYNRAASLLQAMLARGDLTPIDGKPHCGFVHGGDSASAQEASHV